MSKLIQRISFLTILVLGIISVVLVAMVYFGGNDAPMIQGEDSYTVPKITDTLLIWSYALIGAALLLTVVVSLAGFFKNLAANPKSALKTLIPIVIFVLVFVVGWLLGSDDKISIIGYEGTENIGFWAHFTDMMIFAIYALFVAIGLTIICSAIYTRLK